jgi:NitT/TauT family transport system substrate-binding protein
MKKFLILLLTLTLLLFTACGTKKGGDILIVMPDGAPALVFAQMMSETQELDGYKISYEVVAGVQGIQSKIEDFDIAVMPLNLGANLYNQGENLQLLSVNIHGVLYIVGKEGNIGTLSDLSVLKGKVVYNIGKGGTPDITFLYMLDRAGIAYAETDGEIIDAETVALKYVNDGSVIIAGLLSGTVDYAVIGEPVVTAAVARTSGAVSVICDLQQLWKEATGQEGQYAYPQAGIFAKKSFIENNKAIVKKILEKTEGVSDWLVNNKETAVNAIKNHYGTSINILTDDSIARSNIYTLYTQEARQAIDNYFEILNDKNALSIGGRIPDEGMYCVIQ